MAEHKKEKPGIMVYFDLLDTLRLLSDREKGILFQAMLEYGKYGKEPDMGKNSKLDVVWCMMQHRLDIDDETYYKKTARSKYGAYVRWTKKKGDAVLDYDDWVQAGGLKEEKSYLDASDAIA